MRNRLSRDLVREFDAWSASGATAAFWWRDDDATSDTPAFQRMLEIVRELQITVALAVVPDRADESLLNAVSGTGCPIWQHGWSHHFYTDGEFGEARPLGAMLDDALRGQQALDRLFLPAGWQRVFVPPNHQLSMSFKQMTRALGYSGVSAGVPLTAPVDGVFELNAEIDVMDWPNGRILPFERLCAMATAELQSRRLGNVPLDRPIGLLTHHLAFDDAAWESVTTLMRALVDQPPVVFLRAADLFGPLDSSRHTNVLDRGNETPPVTVVIVSCGRQDLLQRTLDSFVEFNTYPAWELLVMEDGRAEANRGLRRLYRDRPIRWLETGARLGQVAAIDLAYASVHTDYIFHCEDDWEFYAPGFMERSLSVLEANPFILQVWLRALGDTNRHPILDSVLWANGVPYRLLDPDFHTDEWGEWHGFSWNPGLRRRREYALLGSYGSLDPAATGKAYEVERRVSTFYRKRGFLAGILVDNDGNGYVRHLGWGRRVTP